MKPNLFRRLHLLTAASTIMLAVPAAHAQSTSDNPAQTPPAGQKTQAQKPKTATQAKTPSGYATEAEARAHCKTVVWVDNDHFNHYPGSREYGKKPGTFACEQG